MDTIATDGKVATDIPQEVQDEDYDVYKPMEPEADKPKADAFTPEMYDALISAEVLLPNGDTLIPTIVIGREQDASGNPIGMAHTNPTFDTRIYDVQFPDRHTETYAINIIAENIDAQVDDDGKCFLLLGEILDHCHDNTAIKSDNKLLCMAQTSLYNVQCKVSTFRYSGMAAPQVGNDCIT